ncbi:hypothetical protein RDWZM_003182 [Blomia tropicalis]|uniref:RRM domain-containing protein n=1 Tax=Blomia tropicalis TaxID=40697 RepID=A0A9Q0MHQ2_BLOTA|nr:hypothetical protein RDWZM_003182 [Blomia tropicalis]
MASIEPEKIKSSWADEMEDDEPGEPHIEIDGDTKIVTEVSLVDGKKFRTIRHYRVEKRKVAKDVARRKTWVKFGLAESDPSTSTTSLTDAVNLEFLASKDEEVAEQDQNNANQFGGNQADKATGNSKGFAFVSFEMREYALRAIKGVNGHGYNNLILSVEWARPSGN